MTVSNGTKAKVHVMWCVPGSEDADKATDFEVVPMEGDIAPGCTMDFKIAFRPSQENFYYFQVTGATAGVTAACDRRVCAHIRTTSMNSFHTTIEAYVFFKSRNRRVSPPV